MIRLLKVAVQYHFVVIDGEETGEIVSDPVVISSGDWRGYSAGDSQAAIGSFIEGTQRRIDELHLAEQLETTAETVP